ncbi:MAG: site-specific integrase [Clostridia bacterium]
MENGTIYFSQALNCYVAQYHEPSGKRKTLKQKKNEKVGEFKSRFNKIITDINQGSYIEKNFDTCLSIIKNYVEQKHDDGITSDRTYIRDLGTINQLETCCNNWINKPIQKVSAFDIEQSKKSIREYANNTIDKIWRFINVIFKIGISRRKIIYNPMDDETLVKPISKKANKQVESLTQEEESKLLEVLSKSPNKQYNNIILLQLYTGARIGEILALSKDCINLKNNSITIYRTITRDKNDKAILGQHTKTYCKKTGLDKGRRCFPMQPKVRKLIEEILANKITNMHNLLFWDYSKNRIITDGMINSYLSRINKISPNESITGALSTHRLRHTFITRCQEKNLSLAVIQSLVGHVQGSTITNDTYTSVSLNFIQQELEKMF